MIDATSSSAGSCQILLDANGGRASGCTAKDPQTTHKVAQEFESLLVGQMLKAAKFNALGSDGSVTGADTMMDYAEQQFARLLSQNGGLGLAPTIEAGLNQGKTATDSQPAADAGGAQPDTVQLTR